MSQTLSAIGVSVLDCEHKTPAAQDSGFPYIAIPDIQDGRVLVDQARLISEADLTEWNRRTTPRGGDILVTRRGRVGDTAPIPDGLRCAIGQNLVLLRSDGMHVDQAFLRWAVRSPQWWAEVDRLMNVGAVFSSLNVKDIARIRLDFPPLAKQQAIAEVLGALDDKIAANTALATTMDQYASTVLLQSLSTDRVPLDSLSRITMGSSPKGETLNEAGNGVPFYQGVRDYGFRSPTRRVFTTSPVRSADAGDILVSVRAPVGDVNVANEPLCIGRGIAAVRSTTGTQATLFHQLKSERDAWEPFEAEGTVFGSINRDQLHGIQLRPVLADRVSDVEDELTSLEASIAATLAENRTLTAIRDALLPQLMSGKLRVRDAEAAASEAGV
jgi:type I restriction enzyme S subunit